MSRKIKVVVEGSTCYLQLPECKLFTYDMLDITRHYSELEIDLIIRRAKAKGDLIDA